MGNFGFVWIVAILIGASILVGMLYVLSKMFSSAAMESPSRPRSSYDPRGLGGNFGGQ